MPNRSALARILLALALALLAFGRTAPGPVRASLPPEFYTARPEYPSALAWLASAGASLVQDYGAFSLWRLPQPGAAARAESHPAGLRLTSGAIYLRGYTLSTGSLQPEPTLPDALRLKPAAGPGLWLVQFAGPVLPAWLDALAGAGLEPVAYLPENAYLVWGEDPSGALAASAELAGLVRWQGAYHPAYRLHPALRDAAAAPQGGSLAVTVQLYDSPALPGSLARLGALAEETLSAPEAVLNLTNLRLRLPASSLAEVASWPDVVNIEPYAPPVLLDEIQGQVVAGSITSTGGKTTASGPGYLAWLDSLGFPADPSAYPIIDVIDDGIDIGDASNVLHPDFHVLGSLSNPDRVAYIANCSKDATGNGVGGHGNLNAGIIAGYNNLAGFPYENAAGFQYGLGISPYGQVAGTKMFPNDGTAPMLEKCLGSDSIMIYQAYALGARITSDSWGAPASGAYDATAQIYDALTRDAFSDSGNQSMLHVFAAGNSGSAARTINTPGTAKNVLTVGATENPRDPGVSCNGWTDADSADDMAPYSSRGPTADGRAKPDIVAPGTHVSGPASMDPAYTGTYVCPPKYYPPGQTLYAWSTGTSHATPAVAGGAQLAYEYYRRAINPGQTPSPAMLKALLLNSPRYLTGLSAGDTLPSPSQGWGMLNLGTLFDGAIRHVVDQTTIFTATGQVFTLAGQVIDPSLPLRVSLVWTDAPGSTVASKALVNDLDLEVTAGGVTYRGNVFAGALSAPGGSADALNNVENVFLPAGTTGEVTVRVVAASLGGDGVPGDPNPTDQDFALVLYNSTGAVAPNLAVSGVRTHVVEGNFNTALEPGETFDLEVDLANLPGSGAAQGISAALSVAQGAAAVLQGSSGYGDMLPNNAVHTNLAPFRVQIDPAQPCGGRLALVLTVSYAGGQVSLPLPEFTTALPAQAVESFAYGGPPLAIPDRVAGQDPVSLRVPVTIASDHLMYGLTATVDITHPWVGDLQLSLEAPNGDTITLANRRGSSTDDYTFVTFDDSAAQAISTAQGPFSGSYRPEQPLSTLGGRMPTGTWNLVITDNAPTDVGTLNAFSLKINRAVCTAYTRILLLIYK